MITAAIPPLGQWSRAKGGTGQDSGGRMRPEIGSEGEEVQDS